MPTVAVTRERFDAVLCDLDGVLTATARLHARCWKEMFDAFLADWSERAGEAQAPFDPLSDYTRHVDGKRREDGVRDFLASRGITLPEGDEDAPVAEESVHGLGNRKQVLVEAAIHSGGVDVFEASVRWVRGLLAEGYRLAVVSSSKNCRTILDAAGIADLFEVVVDGTVAAARRLPGKPAPDTFLEAARELGVVPARAVVVEDALAGVEAGRAGGFGLVIGVDRGAGAEALAEHGADVVVHDLAELLDP